MRNIFKFNNNIKLVCMIFFWIWSGKGLFLIFFIVRNVNWLLFKVGKGKILIIVKLILISVVNLNRLFILFLVNFIFMFIILIGFFIFFAVWLKLLISC